MVDLTQTFSDLVRVETTLWNTVDARLRADHDLTVARFETMRVLGQSGPCRVQDIADELAIGWSGASKIVDRVEAAGHARRRPNPDDARSSLIALTSRGQALLIKASRTAASQLHSVLAGNLTPTELRAFSDTLAKLPKH